MAARNKKRRPFLFYCALNVGNETELSIKTVSVFNVSDSIVPLCLRRINHSLV